MFRIAIANEQRQVRIDRARLRRITRAVLGGEGVTDAEISLAFVDDHTIQCLNRQFLSHDEATDVISFPMNEPGAPLQGELVISAETAKRVAKSLRHPVQEELDLYLIHGLLHLCGYDDLTTAKRRAMRVQERHYLSELTR